MTSLKTCMSALAAIGMSTVVFANSPAATAPASSAPATKSAEASKPAVDAAKAMAAHETISGKVASINVENKTFKLTHSLKGADGKETSKEVEMSWAETTKLAWKNDKMTAATATDLKVGEEVTVKAETRDGKVVASEVWLHPAAAAAAKPATK